MQKHTVQYEDFDGVNRTENLYFNISKSELLENIELKDELLEVHAILDKGAKTDVKLELSEIKKVLDLVKRFAKLSYGIRSEDGKTFRKSQEIWEDFQFSAVYDTWLFELFEKPEKAVSFLVDSLPKDLVEKAATEQGVDLNQFSERAAGAQSEPARVNGMTREEMEQALAQMRDGANN